MKNKHDVKLIVLAFWFAASLFSQAAADQLAEKLPLIFEGTVEWTFTDASQKIRIKLDKPKQNPDGSLMATGIEEYWALGRPLSINVEMRIDMRTRRVEIQEIPQPHPMNPIPLPLVGRLSRDLMEIWSIDDDLADMSASFRLVASTTD